MNLTFHGAAQTVTGSQHLIQVNGSLILLDCGLYQGKRAESYERNRNFLFDVQKLDAVILSHSHIDHSGNLPNLVRSGYCGPIYTTPPTADLVDVMLRDSGHVLESVAANLNFHRAKRGEPPIEPLYTEEDGGQVAQYLQPMAYGQDFEPAPGVSARFVEAGHILGSAAIALRLEEKRRQVNLWFSGDIGRPRLPLLRDPVLPREVDYLVMESTYGDKPHRDPEQAFAELREVTSRTLRRGGKVIIPAFAVGRTQELVYDFQRLIDSGDIPRVPVIVDSPLAVQACDIFRQHVESFDQETHDFIRARKNQTVLGFDLLTYTRSAEESKILNERKGPMIIISASGMAETGRILYHLKYNIEDPRNTILIVSWQAPNTLGRRLADREKQVRILGNVFERRAEVATIGGLSAHAGQDFLLEYAAGAKDRTRQIFLVHGEEKPAATLQAKMKEVGIEKVAYPPPHVVVEI